MLKINNLEVKVDTKTILQNFNLTINDGEIHVLMGPNGTGKSTICKALLHHFDYKITKGNIIFNDLDITNKDTSEIASLGIFLISQNPMEIEGVSNSELIRLAYNKQTNEQVDIFELNTKLKDIAQTLKVDKQFVHRDINYNMSGGEKKKNELMQLLMLKPKFIILDEIDSGLDIDALKLVGQVLNNYYEEYKPMMLIITHHLDFLNNFKDYKVSIIKNGTIIKNGSKSLAKLIEKEGFEANTISGFEKNE